MAVPAAAIVADIDAQLEAAANPVRAEKERQYLRNVADHLGVSVPTLHAIARSTSKGLDRERLLTVVHHLWDDRHPPIHERRFVAVDLLANRAELLTPEDLPLLERFAREARTWAIIDTLAPRAVGPLAERHPEPTTAALDRWVEDDDFWVRRTVLLAHLVPLRQGRGDWVRFSRYADQLLEDREFFVAKAIGWVLRDTARRRPELVLAWAEPRMHRMSAVAAREVVKPYPSDVQQRLRGYQRGG